MSTLSLNANHTKKPKPDPAFLILEDGQVTAGQNPGKGRSPPMSAQTPALSQGACLTSGM